MVRRSGTTTSLAIAVCLVIALTPSAAAASNDALATPDTLTFQTSAVGNNTNFTTGAEPLCPDMSATAWWKVRGNGAEMTFSTEGSAGNTIIAVYRRADMFRVGQCHDDVGNSATLRWSRTTVGAMFSARQDYLVQVGAANGQTGFVKLTVTAPQPANDDRSKAATLVTDQLNDAHSTRSATGEAGEVLRCAGQPFAATLWYRWSAPAVGDATFAADSISDGGLPTDTFMAVYRDAGTAPLACNDDRGMGGAGSGLSLRVAPGPYLVQVGAAGRDELDAPFTNLDHGKIQIQASFRQDLDIDRDGSAVPDDCNDGDPSINPRAVDIPTDNVDQDCVGGPDRDADNDGSNWSDRPPDCNDNDRRRYPGNQELRGNKIDEDCRHGAAPAILRASVLIGVLRAGTAGPITAVSRLKVETERRRARVEVRCRGCTVDRRRYRLRRKKSLDVAIGGPQKQRIVITVRVTRKGWLGSFTRFKVRLDKRSYSKVSRCTRPSSRRPRRCPAD